MSNARLKIVRRDDGRPLNNAELFALMEEAGLDIRSGYEDVGIQSDGQPVIFDKCGQFGYLDTAIYRAVIVID